MRSLAIGLLAGTALLQTRAELPPFLSLLLLALAVACLAAAAIRIGANRPRTKILVMAVCGVALGFAWSGWIATRALSDQLPAELEGRDIELTGVIESLPVRFDQGVRFVFSVEQARLADGSSVSVPARLALSWYAGFGNEEVRTVADVQPGERWHLNVRLKRPHGNANPYNFDYEAWLLEQGLRATGTVRDTASAQHANLRLQEFDPSPARAIERLRSGLRDRIFAALPEKAYAGVIVALVIGDQREISQADWKVFNRSGIGHLMSISGLHITMIAGLFAWLASALWRRSFFTRAELPLRLPAQKLAALAGAFAALSYVLLAGFGVPAQRTLYMLSVVAAALWFGRIASVSHVLCAALIAVLLLDPWAVLWPGFWLSFGAVGLILYASVGRAASHAPSAAGTRPRWRSSLESGVHTQYVVTLGLVPLSVLLFGQVSLISPLANAVAIPLVGFLVTPLALAGSMAPAPVSGWMLECAHWLVELLASALAWMSALPDAVWAAPSPPWWAFFLAVAGTLWILAPRGWPVRWLGIAAWLPLLVNAPSRPEAGMWLTAFDVGQGSAILVETPSYRLLYDTGPAYSPEADAGNRVILPYLRGRGITRLDAMVVSHNDNDHSGGALSILDDIRIATVYSSLLADSPIAGRAADHRRCLGGQSWERDGVRFEMLHPAPEDYGNAKARTNAKSCTLRISYGTHAVLLPGDIEAAQEARLVGTAAGKLRATVLLAPHHGSGTSSTPAFLQAVQPQMAVFQVGYRNRYRHPKAEVFARYGSLGIARLRSDEAGAITMRFGETISVSSYRDEHARYWHGR